MLSRPERKLSAVLYTQFLKNPVYVLLDCTCREAQLTRDFFVRFRLLDQVNDLPFPEREIAARGS